MSEKPKLPSGQTVTWNEERQAVYYSNLMGISMTPFDVALIFGQIGNATAENIEGIALAKIILAPEQAANLLKLLGMAVGKFVENNGALRAKGSVDEDAFLRELEEKSVRPNEGR